MAGFPQYAFQEKAVFANVQQNLIPSFYQILKALEDSNSFEFFLTGSRFFGGFTEVSDYDFFTMESSGVEEFLISLGFTLDSDLSYLDDPTFSKVFTFEEENGKVQVQLIRPRELSRKMLIQRLLRTKYPEGLPGDKVQKRELWQLTHHILKQLSIS